MINMKVIRVKAKVATKPVVEDVAFWKRVAEQNAELAKTALAEVDSKTDLLESLGGELLSCRNQIMGLKQKLETEQRNHAVATAGVQVWQKDAEESRTEVRSLRAKIELLSAELGESKAETLEWEKTSQELANRLCVAMDEKRAAESEAANLNIELMEREACIDELKRRIAWLEAEADNGSTVAS